MKKLLGSLTFLLITGCGMDEGFKDVIGNENLGYRISTADDMIGAEANRSRKYMSDRGFSSEEVGYEIGTVDNMVGAEANRDREALSDQGISGESFQDFTNKASDDIGSTANAGRKSLSDVGFSSEKAGDAISKTDDSIGTSANIVREHLSDRNISGEDFQNGTTQASKDFNATTDQASDDIGAEANRDRDYFYERGIENMRHGDQDTQVAIENNKYSSEQADKALAEAAAKQAQAEAKAAQAQADYEAQVAANNKAESEQADKALADRVSSLESRVSDLENSILITNSRLISEVSRLDNADETNLATIRSELAVKVAEIVSLINTGDSQLALDLAETQSLLEQAIIDGDEQVILQLQVELTSLNTLLSEAIIDTVSNQGLVNTGLQNQLNALESKRQLLTSQFLSFRSAQYWTNYFQGVNNYQTYLAMNNLSSRITTNASNINGLNGSVGIIQGQIANILQDILDLEQEDVELLTLINTLSGEVSSLEISDITSLQNALNQLQINIDNISLTPGPKGDTGESCSVSPTSGGVNITCGNQEPVLIEDGAVGPQGLPGLDAQGVIVHNLCGNDKEVVLELPNSVFVSYMTKVSVKDNGNPNDDVDYLSVLKYGSYVTTDGEACHFIINANGISFP